MGSLFKNTNSDLNHVPQNEFMRSTLYFLAEATWTIAIQWQNWRLFITPHTNPSSIVDVFSLVVFVPVPCGKMLHRCLRNLLSSYLLSHISQFMDIENDYYKCSTPCLCMYKVDSKRGRSSPISFFAQNTTASQQNHYQTLHILYSVNHYTNSR